MVRYVSHESCLVLHIPGLVSYKLVTYIKQKCVSENLFLEKKTGYFRDEKVLYFAGINFCEWLFF